MNEREQKKVKKGGIFIGVAVVLVIAALIGIIIVLLLSRNA